jgi:hypothetical protein
VLQSLTISCKKEGKLNDLQGRTVPYGTGIGDNLLEACRRHLQMLQEAPMLPSLQ